MLRRSASWKKVTSNTCCNTQLSYVTQVVRVVRGFCQQFPRKKESGGNVLYYIIDLAKILRYITSRYFTK